MIVKLIVCSVQGISKLVTLTEMIEEINLNEKQDIFYSISLYFGRPFLEIFFPNTVLYYY